MGIDLDLFTSELVSLKFVLCLLCFFPSLELNVSVSFAFSVLVGLELARYDISVLSE